MKAIYLNKNKTIYDKVYLIQTRRIGPVPSNSMIRRLQHMNYNVLRRRVQSIFSIFSAFELGAQQRWSKWFIKLSYRQCSIAHIYSGRYLIQHKYCYNAWRRFADLCRQRTLLYGIEKNVFCRLQNDVFYIKKHQNVHKIRV